MDNKEMLKELLMAEDVVGSIRKNIDNLIFILPEIKDMIGFKHNHPHHHLDVWEHTLLALSLSPKNFDIRLALLLHDIGKPHSFQDGDIRHFKGHAEKSKNISQCIMVRLGFDKKYIGFICKIVAKHDIPLTEQEIRGDLKFSKILFEVQKCDALAHNPDKNAKRLTYMSCVENWFDKFESKNNL